MKDEHQEELQRQQLGQHCLEEAMNRQETQQQRDQQLTDLEKWLNQQLNRAEKWVNKKLS